MGRGREERGEVRWGGRGTEWARRGRRLAAAVTAAGLGGEAPVGGHSAMGVGHMGRDRVARVGVIRSQRGRRKGWMRRLEQ